MNAIVNEEGVAFAYDMVEENRVNHDRRFILGKNEKQEIENNTQYWLAKDSDGNLLYPIGKNDKLYLSALRKAVDSATADNNPEIAGEAQKILNSVESNEDLVKPERSAKMDQIVDILEEHRTASSMDDKEMRKALLDEGDFICWRDGQGVLNRGRVVRASNAGSITLPDQKAVRASEENPALLVRLYNASGNGFRETEQLVAVNAQSVEESAPLPPPRQLANKQWAFIKDREIEIYGEIGGYGEFSALNFVNQLKDIKGPLNISINTYGGDVFEGVVVRNALKARRDPVNILVTGVAASIGSYILTGGDHVSMPTNAAIMVHEPWGGVVGNARDMFAMGEALLMTKKTIIDGYVEKSGKAFDEWEALVEKETWMDGAFASEMKIVDTVLDPVDMAAAAKPIGRQYAMDHLGIKNVPNSLLAKGDKPELQAAKRKLKAQRLKIFELQRQLESLESQG